MPEWSPGQRPAVLTVDDDGPVLRFLTVALGDLYRVLPAEGALEALLLLDAHPGPIDLLICDWHLPGMEGVELGLCVRRQRPGTPVLLISGEPCEEPLPAGFVELSKPFTAQGLRERVRFLLSLAA